MRKAVSVVAMDDRGTWIAAGSQGGCVSLYGVAACGELAWTALGAGPGVTALAADRGDAILVGFETGAVVRLCAATSVILATVGDAHAKAVTGIANAAPYYATASRDGSATAWRSDGDALCAVRDLGPLADVAALPDKFAVAAPKSILVFDLGGLRLGEVAAASAVAVRFVGESLLAVASASKIQLWDARSGEDRGSRPVAARALAAAAGSRLAAITAAGALETYDADMFKTPDAPPPPPDAGHAGPVLAVVALSEGRFATSAAFPDASLKLWRGRDGDLLRTYVSRGEIRALAAWEGGHRFAAAALDRTARVHAVDADGRDAASVAHPAPVVCCACAVADGSPILATAAADKAIRAFVEVSGGTWEARAVVAGADAPSLLFVGDCLLAGARYPETRLTVWPVAALAAPRDPARRPVPHARLAAHASDGTTLAAVDENRAVSCSCDDTLLVWARGGDGAWARDGECVYSPAVKPPPPPPPPRDDDAGDFRDMLAPRASNVALCAWGAGAAVVVGSASSPQTLVVRDLGGERGVIATLTFDAAVAAVAASGGVLCVGDAEGGVHFVADAAPPPAD